MKEGDDAVTRMRKGQSFSADVKVAATRSAMTSAIMTIMRAGSEPTPRKVGEIVDKSPNTVKWHFFSAYVTAVASQSIQVLVKEVPPIAAPLKPPIHILLLAHRPTDVPKSWQDACLESARQSKLLSGRSRHRPASGPIPGRATIDFLSASPVIRFAPRLDC